MTQAALKNCFEDPSDDCREYLTRADAGMGLIGAALSNMKTWGDCCRPLEERVNQAVALHARLRDALKKMEEHLVPDED